MPVRVLRAPKTTFRSRRGVNVFFFPSLNACVNAFTKQLVASAFIAPQVFSSNNGSALPVYVI